MEKEEWLMGILKMFDQQKELGNNIRFREMILDFLNKAKPPAR